MSNKRPDAIGLNYADSRLKRRGSLSPPAQVTLAVANLLLAVSLTFFVSLATAVYQTLCDWLGFQVAISANVVIRDVSTLLLLLNILGTFVVVGIAVFHPRVPLWSSIVCAGLAIGSMVLWVFREGV